MTVIPAGTRVMLSQEGAQVLRDLEGDWKYFGDPSSFHAYTNTLRFGHTGTVRKYLPKFKEVDAVLQVEFDCAPGEVREFYDFFFTVLSDEFQTAKEG